MKQVLSVAGLLAVSIVCHGQASAVHGSLRVAVMDPSGAFIPEASITAKMAETNWSHTLVVGSEDARFPALTPGEYAVTVTAQGFEPQQSAVRILLGHEAPMRFGLRPGTHREQVTVGAQGSTAES
jgi:hypothetical protein